MKVQELINLLERIPNKNTQIYLSSDEEGNSFGTLERDSIEVGKDFVILYPYDEHVDIF